MAIWEYEDGDLEYETGEVDPYKDPYAGLETDDWYTPEWDDDAEAFYPEPEPTPEPTPTGTPTGTPTDTTNQTTTTNTGTSTSLKDYIDDIINNLPKVTMPILVDDDGDGRPDRIVNGETGETLLELKQINDYLIAIGERLENIPSFNEWLTQSGLSLFDIEDMKANLEAMGEYDADADLAAADQRVADSLGISLEDYLTMKGQITQEYSVGDFEGMNPQERQLRERELQNILRDQEQKAMRMVESIRANTGSATRAYMKADDVIRTINDSEIQYRVAMAQEEYERQKANMDAHEAYLERLLDYGDVTSKQYLDQLAQNRAIAFQAYSAVIDAAIRENEMYLQQYNSDLNAIQMHIDAMYQAVNLELGVTQAYMDLMQQFFEQSMAAWIAQVEIAAAAINLEMLWDSANPTAWDNFMGLLELIISGFTATAKVVAAV